MAPGDTAAQLDVLQDRYKEYYATLESYRASDSKQTQRYADAALALETKKQQELMDIHVAAAEQRLELGTGDWEDMQLASIGRLLKGYTTFSAGATREMYNFFQSFTDGFADSIGRAIVYSDDLNGALKSVADEALSSLISGLVKLGVQWLINAAIGSSIQETAAATSMATTTAQATAAAAAWAPAAALASLASFGANAAPASAGMLATTGVAEMIAATANFAGAFDKGGTIPGGKWGIVGEFGPEIVQGPANVTGREKTMDLVRSANQPAAAVPAVAPIVNLKNINVLDKSIVGDYLSSPSGEKMLMNVIQKNRKALA
jgi:hypothetical protein